jgi:hypothetical protein
MPRATVIQESVRRELKSCPGGWVDLKQLPYSDMLRRQDKAMQYSTEPGKADSKVNIAFANEWTTKFDFARCIVDHNLEDEDGNKLDFKNQLVLDILDPRIGAEIDQLIAEMHTVEEDAVEDFTPAPSSSSTDMLKTPKSDTDAMQ